MTGRLTSRVALGVTCLALVGGCSGSVSFGPGVGTGAPVSSGAPTGLKGAVPVLYVNGQSNATVGKQPAASVYNGDDLLTWSGGTWVPARADQGVEEALGIGAWAGRVMRTSLSSVGGVGRADNFGHPGAPIAYFLPQSTDIALAVGVYDVAKRNNYKLARDTWTASGVEPTVLAWAQGEADGGASKDQHFSALSTLVDAWWEDYPKLERVLLIKTAEGACGADVTGVRAAEMAQAAADARVVLIDLDDLTKEPAYHNGCHYTLAGYEQLADRILGRLVPQE